MAGQRFRLGNPLRDEGAALRVVLLVLVALLLVALAARLATWLGLLVFLAELVAVTVLLVRARRLRAAAAAARDELRARVDDTPTP
jgi:ABC-type transport system involved in cytochrome bd biosynthesis fused ATPase/permease subunit